MTGPALPADERPYDDTPIHTEDLPPTPVRDRNISVEAWIEAPRSVRDAGADIGGVRVAYKRRLGSWLLWRAGPARPGPETPGARYVAVLSHDLSVHHTFRLLPDGTGAGVGPSGAHHTRFRAWKEDLVGRSVDGR